MMCLVGVNKINVWTGFDVRLYVFIYLFIYFTYIEEVAFPSLYVCLFVGWLVCQQDYTKTTKCIRNETWMDDGIDPE